MRELVSTGDVVRTSWPGSHSNRPNLYLGSGRAGACFDAYGLMNAAREEPGEGGIGRTALTHADHWHREGTTGMDYWLPLGRLMWADEPLDPTKRYRQHLSLHDGTLQTTLEGDECTGDLRAYFNPDLRDILAVEVSYEATTSSMPSIALRPNSQPRVPMHEHLDLCASFGEDYDPQDGWWSATVSAGTAESVLAVSLSTETGEANLSANDDGVEIHFGGERGSHLLLVGAAGVARSDELKRILQTDRTCEQYWSEARSAWHKRWGKSWVDLPIQEYQALWARSLYYVLASYAPEVRSPAPPHGWSGHGWGFHFPQDVSYVHPVLLRHGHFDIAKAWVEFYRNRIGETRRWTEQVFDADGTMWEWEYPIGAEHSRPHPNDTYPFERFHFEIHNAAYPARMAAETAEYVDDDEWASTVAWPVVRESARFYASVMQQENDGNWGIHLEPSMGQDELGGQNAKNYLCALFSAWYTLQTAVEMAEDESLTIEIAGDELGRWRRILDDGIAIERLRCDSNYYLPNEDVNEEDVRESQKHPVQLNPLTFVPLPITDATRTAFENRDSLCHGMENSRSRGWTLPAYALAASHLGDSDALLRELDRLVPGELADPGLVQLYETSGARERPYYVTSHGLILQALVDAMVHDYWGEEQLGTAWPSQWGDASFNHLYLANGPVSGRYENGEWTIDRHY